MKNAWLWIVIVVIVLGGGYFYRHQIKAMFSGGASTPISYGVPSGTTAPASGATISWVNGTKGQNAVGANGMTLYRFDKDTAGVSNCNGSCAGIWPPYTATSAPATLPANVTLITRTDGLMQFAYKGMPLYYYSGDTKAGDTNGDGFNGIWHLVNP